MTISIGVRLTVPHSLPPSLRSCHCHPVRRLQQQQHLLIYVVSRRQTDRPTMGLTGKSNASLQAPPPSLTRFDDDKIARPVARRCGVGLFNCTVGCCCFCSSFCIFRLSLSLSTYVSLLSLSPPLLLSDENIVDSGSYTFPPFN